MPGGDCDKTHYSAYIISCIPMSRSNPAQNNSHREACLLDGERNQSDRSLHDPAVTAIVPITAWSKAIFSAEG
jgi:hypothetical protein